MIRKINKVEASDEIYFMVGLRMFQHPSHLYILVFHVLITNTLDRHTPDEGRKARLPKHYDKISKAEETFK